MHVGHVGSGSFCILHDLHPGSLEGDAELILDRQ